MYDKSKERVTSPISYINLTISVSQRRQVGEDIHKFQHTYLQGFIRWLNSPGVIVSYHAGKYSTVIVQVMLLLFIRVHTQIHSNAICLTNAILSLIQRDIHDWNLSHPQWATCCCTHKKYFYKNVMNLLSRNCFMLVLLSREAACIITLKNENQRWHRDWILTLVLLFLTFVRLTFLLMKLLK